MVGTALEPKRLTKDLPRQPDRSRNAAYGEPFWNGFRPWPHGPPRGSLASMASEEGAPGGSNVTVDFARQNKEATNKAVLARYLTTGQLNLRAASANEVAAALTVTYQYGTHGHQWQLGTELHITPDMEQFFIFA